ncbi:MAG: GNAT family N-acetyltransferase [unclassified Hahellaceae]|nr:GNAT family N-acetyltransferase [Hahellaceae bacterium]|tara:strand:+ start:11813 stop:12334 length:522 start_codon:yes stop_codon:yes gene_type:complete
MHIKKCSYENSADQILEILNQTIATSTALYDYRPREAESMVPWFATKEACSYPVLGAFNDKGRLLGFASFGAFRNWPAYKYSVEHSVYIREECRGMGLASLLMKQLIEEAKQQNYHVIVGGIDAANQASVALHLKLGFQHAGTIKHAGFKFGRWLDLSFYQLLLDTPIDPVDG